MTLFNEFKLGNTPLSNRVVMAPMTRSRAPEDIATEQIALHYTQRATAGLIISEGTPISREGQGYLFNPGIYTPEQIQGWKLVTDSVHSVGGRMFAQLWHVGRVSHTSIQIDGKAPVSATTRQAQGAVAFGYGEDGEPGFVPTSVPRPLTTEEVARVVEDFAQAAQNAIDAGFDGVEIHGANGYLLEQFLNPLVNDRTDQYGASNLQDRLRFVFEVVDAACARIGADRVGIRISPYGQLFDMPLYPEIDETYSALCAGMRERGIAYVHVMDQTHFFMAGESSAAQEQALRKLLKHCKAELGNTALILAGDMTRERADALLEENLIDLAAFGQPFIGNPDLVARLKNGWPLTTPDRDTYYGGDAHGYIDYAPYRA
ncbi:alkene reductase [Pseudomonas syringae]|uniref:alkene reductase n=1 Tax=Pseudomonas syringae TaxID=317 RepID=UPI000CD34196|nr:alkene reductase [Pseudomonas syringae]MCF5199087.1 alkene reductase [Pseudomonas syringae]MCF5211426.1 alkene reductase [Pseudomonas syringae]MCF5215654.1 alkene reductase [Pseudomonas syringae]MCF5220416.1 alkene reductase [Pseudomonas syringae]MCF5267068.1 alkene reductase [Pseudomonas syringae]